MEKIILPSTNIKGDITTCGIENQLIGVQRNSALSVTELKTYASYDLCTKQIIRQYDVPEMTGMAGFYGILVALSVMAFAAMLSSRSNYDY